MGIHKYKVLLKIVEIGNITKAAMELGYSQSAISHIVSTLETEWNIKLLNRSQKGVRLTPEGEALLPTIRTIVNENNNLALQISELQHLEQGIISVGAFPSVLNNLLPALMTSFSALYPQIQFNVHQGGYQDVEQMIHDGDLDCGFVSIPTAIAIESIPLMKDQLYAIFPKGSKVEQTRFPITDISKESFIMIREIDHEFSRFLQKHNIQLKRKYFSDYEYSVLPMVANGLGMCILPELLLKDAPYELEIKELDPPVWRTIGIAYNPDQTSKATRKFIHHVQSHFQKTESKKK